MYPRDAHERYTGTHLATKVSVKPIKQNIELASRRWTGVVFIRDGTSSGTVMVSRQMDFYVDEFTNPDESQRRSLTSRTVWCSPHPLLARRNTAINLLFGVI